MSEIGCGQHRVNQEDGSSAGTAASRSVMPSSASASQANAGVGPVPARFRVLALFSLFGFSNQMQQVLFVAIVRETEEFLATSAFNVNMMATVFSLVYVVFAPAATDLIEVVGLQAGLRVGSAANALGALMKLAAALWAPNFALVCASQVVASIGLLMQMAVPPLVSSEWFTSPERPVATAVGSLAAFVGMAAGFGIPPFFVSGDRACREGFSHLFGLLAALCCAIALGTFVCVPRHPPRPPCVTSSVCAWFPGSRNSGASQPPTTRSIAAVLTGSRTVLAMLEHRRNRSFVAIVGLVATVGGISTAMSSVLPQLLEAFAIPLARTGLMTSVGIVLGSGACVLGGFYMSQYRNYKLLLLLFVSSFVLFNLGNTVMLAIGIFELGPGSNTDGLSTPLLLSIVIGAMIAGASCAVLPLIPLTLEMAVEVTYPASGGPPTAATMIAMNAAAVLLQVAVASAVGQRATRLTGLALFAGECALITIVGVLVGVTLKNELGRQQVEDDAAADAAAVSSLVANEASDLLITP